MTSTIPTGSGGWRRVSRDRRCPICGRPDWCLIAADGSAAICARTKSAKRCGEAGWLHRLGDERFSSARPVVRSIALTATRPRHDFANLAANYQHAADPGRLHALAMSLGVSVASLQALRIGWSAQHRAWSFPMLDPRGNVVGIRLRRPNGFKFAVAGGKEGLFLPVDSRPDESLIVAEGPTDTAALFDLGFRNVAGRPNCAGGVKLLVELVRIRHRPEVVILADGDKPGQCGAENLATVLVAYSPAVRIIQPPDGIKDAREWLRAGGTHQDVDAVIASAAIRRLVIQAVSIRRSARRGTGK